MVKLDWHTRWNKMARYQAQVASEKKAVLHTHCIHCTLARLRHLHRVFPQKPRRILRLRKFLRANIVAVFVEAVHALLGGEHSK